MKVLAEILAIAELVGRLRAADRDFRVFGSEEHRYELGRPVPEEDLTAFEIALDVKLPEDYRGFLANVANGGAGPFYGLLPFQGCQLVDGYPISTRAENPSDELRHVRHRRDAPRVLEICHQGCGGFSYIVLRGPTFGTIWDGREEFYPTPDTFSKWYREWARCALTRLENMKLVPLLRVGMSKTEVLDAVPGDWKARQSFSKWLFEASDIPAQLELDERGLVTKVNEWGHI